MLVCPDRQTVRITISIIPYGYMASKDVSGLVSQICTTHLDNKAYNAEFGSHNQKEYSTAQRQSVYSLLGQISCQSISLRDSAMDRVEATAQHGFSLKVTSTRNLAIANRLHVSCAHNMSRASIVNP